MLRVCACGTELYEEISYFGDLLVRIYEVGEMAEP